MPEPLTLDGELDRQLKLVRCGQSETIVCPWCGMISDSESGKCCVELTQARERLAESHIKSLERQFAAVRNHFRDSTVQCPYCDAINRPENLDDETQWKRPGTSPWCCDLMVYAVMGIGNRMITQALIDEKRRIEDSIAKVGMN